MIDLTEFSKDLLQDVKLAADADGMFREDAFFEVFCDYLIDVGELATADRAYFDLPGMPGKPSLRVDGYGGDPLAAADTLTLLIADYSQSEEPAVLGNPDIERHFKRLFAFLQKSMHADFRKGLEETSPAFGLTELIAARWPRIEKVRLLLITNKVISTRVVDSRPAGEFQEVPVTYSIWDISRLHKFAASQYVRETIEVDFVSDFGRGLPALPAHLADAGYESYLAVVPGIQLAAIYERWGARLLEQNVRVFLQAKGNVNKGIRNTIERAPERFFAYNNGITATAEKVELCEGPLGMEIARLVNLQIVNGGQTTASIHAAMRKKVDLSSTFVQMKLSIVSPEVAEEFVPKISEYANSQNKVSAADFFSNHPFHVRMEDFSRRVLARSRDGGDRDSKWFYERARGQYNNARQYLSASAKKRFEMENPRSQLFSKTDMAKYLNVWDCKPHIVSRGAQKNFADFAETIAKEWDRNPDQFNQVFYEDAIAKTILFRRTEKIVSDQSWYEGGYRANIVAYALAKIAFDLGAKGLAVDTRSIWDKQALSAETEAAIALVARAVHDVLVNPPAESRNVTEWAKQQACWYRVKALKIDWPESFAAQLVTVEELRSAQRSGVRGQRIDNGIQVQRRVVEAGHDFWHKVNEWGQSNGLLSEKESGILHVASTWNSRPPSEKQCEVVLQALERLQGEGCPYQLPEWSPAMEVPQ